MEKDYSRTLSFRGKEEENWLIKESEKEQQVRKEKNLEFKVENFVKEQMIRNCVHCCLTNRLTGVKKMILRLVIM